MAPPDSGLWTPMSSAEIKRHRRNLPKGHIRETRIATHTGPGWDPVDADEDAVIMEVPSKRHYGAGNTAPPREVAEEIYGMMWRWAQGSRENFALMAQIVRHNNPLSFGHLSDEDLATEIEGHAKAAARKATESVYQSKSWDRGTVIGDTG